MSRIRSVHPGLFTDEAFMSASPLARLLMIGLWTEAWDDGAFEWKPVVLKARIFPADTCDVPALLSELCGLGVIKTVVRNGKSYGLIRNFRKFQRPKKPNSSGVVLPSDVDFLGPEHASSEPVPNQFRTSSEIRPQMEDGGGRKEEDGRKIDNPISLSKAAREIEPHHPVAKPFPSDGSIRYGDFAEISRKAKPGIDPDVVAQAFRRFCKGADPPIPFDDPRIAKRFEGFAKSHRITGH